jgi:hypothetical protein
LAADLSVLGPADAAGSARLVLAVVQCARSATPATPGLQRAERRAQSHLLRVTGTGALGGTARGLNRLHMRGPGRHRLTAAVRAVVEAPWPDEIARGEALLQVLQTGMAVVRDAHIPPTGPGVGGGMSPVHISCRRFSGGG